MADRPQRLCTAPGCGEVAAPGGRCAEHARHGVRARKEKHGFFDARWERFRQLLKAQGNVICQRVNEGRRCIAATYFFHHILEASAFPQFAMDWRNIVGVCRSCHPRPTDKDQGVYVPTLYRPPMSNEPLAFDVVQPGEVVPANVELWCVENRRRLLTGYRQ